jgi:TolB protein
VLLAGASTLLWRALVPRALDAVASLPDASVLPADLLPAPEPLDAPAELVGRLAVLTRQGNIITLRSDGSDLQALTSDAGPQHAYGQPAWSPDGASLAWSEILTENGRDAHALYFRRLEDSIASRVDTGAYPPFYIFWSPDSRRVAFLSSWERELALRDVEVENERPLARVLAQGRPLYFAWAPDGQRFLAHIGGDRLGVYGLDGAKAAVSAAPGDFTTPAWLPDDTLLYTVHGSRGQRLIVAAPDGRELRDLGTYDGHVAFAPSPDGRAAAVVVTQMDVPTNAFGQLHRLDLASGESELVTGQPVIAFFWSPDSRYLAWLAPDDAEDEQAAALHRARPLAQHDDVWLRWYVWDGVENYGLARFVPSDIYLRDYLRFSDQYARSMTPWSPDSRAFVFAGEDEAGTSGIWVQPIAAGPREPLGSGLPRHVVDGIYAAWSPR